MDVCCVLSQKYPLSIKKMVVIKYITAQNNSKIEGFIPFIEQLPVLIVENCFLLKNTSKMAVPYCSR